MKNYKAEIKKEFIKYNRWLNGAKTNIANENECIDNISSLFREIAKEAVGEKENEKFACNCGEMHAPIEPNHTRNKFRSEILSNIEKVIK